MRFLANRHLTGVWVTTFTPLHPKHQLVSAATPTTPLLTIEHLVLLDHLSALHPCMHSYFPVTAWLFNMLISIEMRLCDVGIIDAAALFKSLFHMRGMGDVSLGYMGDNHLPFLCHGVSICCTLHRLTPPPLQVATTAMMVTAMHGQ